MRDEREFWNSEEIKHVQALVHKYEQAPRRTAVQRLVRVHKDAVAHKLPQAWLNPVQPRAEAPYLGLFDGRDFEKARGWETDSGMSGVTFAGCAVGAGGGVTAVLCSLYSAYAAVGTGGGSPHLLFGVGVNDMTQLMVAMGAAGALTFGGITTAAWLPWKRLAKRRMTAVRKLEAQALRAWLRARYGVQVGDEEISEMVEYVIAGIRGVDPLAFTFRTSSGKKLEFTNEDNQNLGWSVREPRKEIEPAKAVELTRLGSTTVKPAGLGFTGEAAVLYEAVTMRLDNLGAQDLTVEQAHMLARAREDLSNTASLVRKMLSLEPLTQAQEAKVTGVLASLMEEVRGMQEQLQADIDRDLDVQAEYIRSRAVISGNGRLELFKAAPEAASANQEEEVDA